MHYVVRRLGIVSALATTVFEFFYVVMLIAVHAWAPTSRKSYALASIVFAAILACLTSAVHFSILVLGREPDLALWVRHLTFEWPSIVYALDILAWNCWLRGHFPVRSATHSVVILAHTEMR